MLADVPAASLSDDAPLYDRPRRAPVRGCTAAPAPPTECAADLLALLRSPRWVYRQYDHQLFLNTVVGPGADAALLRLAGPGLPPSERGVALTTDSNPRATARSTPGAAPRSTLAEGIANLACVGATPVAVVNCLNFGNPEHPEVMWQLSECIDGMAEACRALALPVIGGNVSFYNESGGADIDPTPVLGVLGLVDAVHAPPPGLAWSDGDSIVLVGAREAADGCLPLGGDALGDRATGPPHGADPVRRLRRARRRLCLRCRAGRRQVAGRQRRRWCSAVHDVSSGGLAVALGEMAAAAGTGCTVDLGHAAELFTELPSRFVVATGIPTSCADGPRPLESRPPCWVGRGGDRFTLGGLIDLPVDALREAHEGNLALALGELVMPRACARMGDA